MSCRSSAQMASPISSTELRWLSLVPSMAMESICASQSATGAAAVRPDAWRLRSLHEGLQVIHEEATVSTHVDAQAAQPTLVGPGPQRVGVDPQHPGSSGDGQRGGVWRARHGPYPGVLQCAPRRPTLGRTSQLLIWELRTPCLMPWAPARRVSRRGGARGCASLRARGRVSGRGGGSVRPGPIGQRPGRRSGRDRVRSVSGRGGVPTAPAPRSPRRSRGPARPRPPAPPAVSWPGPACRHR